MPRASLAELAALLSPSDAESTMLPPSLEASLEPPDTESVAFWVVDFSLSGWTVPAMLSPALLAESVTDSRVDFWLSGFKLEAALSVLL